MVTRHRKSWKLEYEILSRRFKEVQSKLQNYENPTQTEQKSAEINVTDKGETLSPKLKDSPVVEKKEGAGENSLPPKDVPNKTAFGDEETLKQEVEKEKQENIEEQELNLTKVKPKMEKENKEQEQGQEEFHCPNCNAVVEKYTPVCSNCGYELEWGE